MLLWSWIRLPETLHPEYRRSLRFGDMTAAILETVREPQSRGYTIAITISFGGLVAYIASIQQIVFDAFHKPHLIGLVFAAIAAPMAVASWANSRVVGRFGLRRVGHTAAAAFMVIALVHVAVAKSGVETLPVFVLFQALTMCAFAFTSSNLSTLAMEHMAPIAGTASSVQGMLGTIGAAILGFLIGQAFDGTVIPYVIGTAGCAVGGFAALVLTEPRNLFARIRKEPGEPSLPSVPDEVV
jgi:DHA1 family bicyclomycin/chloramphenicol resistance-like MFS transporter